MITPNMAHILWPFVTVIAVVHRSSYYHGTYLPPVLKELVVSSSYPPQIIISVPVQTAVWVLLSEGALLVVVAVQESVAGLYLAPVFKG